MYLTNAIFIPSGDHVGEKSNELVSFVRFVPSGFTVPMPKCAAKRLKASKPFAGAATASVAGAMTPINAATETTSTRLMGGPYPAVAPRSNCAATVSRDPGCGAICGRYVDCVREVVASIVAEAEQLEGDVISAALIHHEDPAQQVARLGCEGWRAGLAARRQHRGSPSTRRERAKNANEKGALPSQVLTRRETGV
jgi:hypothetical protein